MTVRSALQAAAAHCNATGVQGNGCVHTSASRYLCPDHPGLGALCATCATGHTVQRHRGERSRCRACDRDDQRPVPVLLLVDDGRFVVGLEFCARCLLAATSDGRRLAA